MNQETVAILKKAVQESGASLQEIDLTEKTTKKEVRLALEQSPAVINLSVAENFEALDGLYDDDLEEYNYRMLELRGVDPESFEDRGAMTENREDLDRRLNKMEAVLKEAKGFKITSVYGTDLRVDLRPLGDRRWYKESGVVEEQGKWDNLPGGEIFTTPDEENVNGTLVLPALDSEIGKEQGVDEFIYVIIRKGKISSIQGGESAEKLRKKLGEAALEKLEKGENLLDTYQCAEISFGANSRARSRVADSEQPYNTPGVSTIEAEKRLDTMHLAFGDTKHGEEGAEGFIGVRFCNF